MEMVMGLSLLIFLLLGRTAPALAALRQFHFVEQLKNWTEAESYCRDKFTDLATIENEDDWTTVSQMVENSGYWGAWMGLYDDVKSWRWSLDNTSLYHTDLGSWFNFTEHNDNKQKHCAGVSNGQLHDYSCQTLLGSVCYHQTTDSYIPVAEPMSWQWAQSYCRQNHTDLASIRDQQELNAIVNATDPNVAYWVGLSRESWKWSDQSHYSFSRWVFGEPWGVGQDCGVAHHGGWLDVACGDIFPFVCSDTIQPSKVLKVTVKTDGSVNINNPLVQEAILKQMEKDLRGQGVTQELSLSWRKQPHGDVFNKTEL